MKKLVRAAFLTFFSILIAMPLTACEQKEQVESFRMAQYLLPREGITMGMREGDVVALIGEGTRSEVSDYDVSVTRLYPSTKENPYSPIQYLIAGQNANDVKYPELDFRVAYGFNSNNELTTVLYHLYYDNIPSSDFPLFIDDIRNMITEEFGDAVHTGSVWLEDTYKDDLGMHKHAVIHGLYQEISLWESDDCAIIFNVQDGFLAFTSSDTQKELCISQINSF